MRVNLRALWDFENTLGTCEGADKISSSDTIRFATVGSRTTNDITRSDAINFILVSKAYNM